MLTLATTNSRIDTTRLAVASDVDLAVAADVRTAIAEALALGAASLLVDLTGVTFSTPAASPPWSRVGFAPLPPAGTTGSPTRDPRCGEHWRSPVRSPTSKEQPTLPRVRERGETARGERPSHRRCRRGLVADQVHHPALA